MLEFFAIFGALAAIVLFLIFVFWVIQYTDDQRRERREADQQARWMFARLQKITKPSHDPQIKTTSQPRRN